MRPWRPLHGAARGFGDRDHRHQHVGGDGLDGAEADHGLLRALLLMLARRRGGSRRSRSPTSPWCRGPEQSPSPASCSCWHPGPSGCSARARRRARARVSRSSTAGRRSFAQRTPLQPSLRGCCEPRSIFYIVGLTRTHHRRGYRLRYESCAKLDADGQDFGQSDALLR